MFVVSTVLKLLTCSVATDQSTRCIQQSSTLMLLVLWRKSCHKIYFKTWFNVCTSLRIGMTRLKADGISIIQRTRKVWGPGQLNTRGNFLSLNMPTIQDGRPLSLLDAEWQQMRAEQQVGHSMISIGPDPIHAGLAIHSLCVTHGLPLRTYKLFVRVYRGKTDEDLDTKHQNTATLQKWVNL